MLTTVSTDAEAVTLIAPRQIPRTLADVRDMLSQTVAGKGLETKLQISAINTVARASGCAPDDLPADPAMLRQHLATISPAMAGLTKGSWSSVRSRLLKGLQRSDVKVMAARRARPLQGDWDLLYRGLKEKGRQASLSRMIGYLNDNGVDPADVTDAIVERFAWELNTTSFRGRPTAIVRDAIRGWNDAVDAVPGWPQQRLTLAERNREGYVLSADKFPASFQQSLTDYLAYLADPPEDDEAPFRGLRPTTLKQREFQFRQMASALAHRGVPLAEIITLRQLLERENVDKICDFFTERRSGTGPPNGQLVDLLRILRPIAIYHINDRSQADWISRRMKRLSGGRSRRFGMTEKNRRRLSVFRDPQHVRDLLLLPYKLLKRAESGTLPLNVAAKKLVRAAVAVELEIMAPIRLQNLSELNMDTDFVRSHAGRNATVHLFIPGNRTKNGEDIELELPRDTMALVDLYMTKYRNHLIEPQYRGTGPRFLFPRPDGTPKVARVFADAICRIMRRELGIKFNLHLFRHLGCYLYLRSHPGQLDVMRRVLGHKDGETTIRFYAFIEQSDAFRLFDSHVLRIREEALRPSRRALSKRKAQP